MTTLRIEKVNALPGAPDPNTMYLVKSGANIEVHVSDNNGTATFTTLNGGTAAEPDSHPFLLMGATNG